MDSGSKTRKPNKGKKKIDLILPVVLISYFMLLLDNSIVFTGAANIANELNLNLAELSWVTNAYALSFGGLLLCGGRLGDLFGRKRVFILGLIIFGISSLFVGLSQGALSIIVSRGVQGIGSAILAPTTLALLMDNYSGEARVRAFSAYSATAGLGGSIGLVVGGIFAGLLSWRDGFFINVPVSFLLIVISLRHIKDQQVKQAGGIDYFGAMVSIIGMISLVYSLVGECHTKAIFILAVVSLCLFVFWQSRAKFPMMPLRLFADRKRLGAYLARFFFIGCMLSVFFLTPQMLQHVMKFSPLQSGMAFFPLTIPLFMTSLKVPKWTKRYGSRKLLIIGILLVMIGMLCLPFFNPRYGYFIGIAIPFLLIGIGHGLCFAPLTVAGVAGVLPEDAGAASGTVNVMHQLGGSIGLSVIVALSTGSTGTVAAYNNEMFIGLLYIVASLFFSIIFVYPTMRDSNE